jgi:hypothetical protein
MKWTSCPFALLAEICCIWNGPRRSQFFRNVFWDLNNDPEVAIVALPNLLPPYKNDNTRFTA